MKDNPLVSVIVNCYNGEKFLLDCLNSLKNQTYKNIEIIFWDNKSTDDSLKIFKKVEDIRFKYFLADNHTTLYKARNLAIKKCSGDFISFLDTDDYWMPEKIQKQMEIFMNTNSKVGLVYTNQTIFINHTNQKEKYIKIESKNDSESTKILKRVGATILTSLIKKKELLKLNYIFDNNYNIIGDLDLFYRLSKICEFNFIKEELAVYRLHGENYLKKNKKEEILELENWKSEYLDKSHNVTKSEKLEFSDIVHHRKVIYFILEKKNFDDIKKIYKISNFVLKLKLILFFLMPNKMLMKLLKF